MPSPTSPATPGPPTRRLALFVHGFGSSPRCWEKLLDLLRKDPRITGALHLECFGYETKAFELRFLRRLPDLTEIAGDLRDELESARFAGYSDITLVGHSQGGLVIHHYLADKVRSGRCEDLKRIREVILIATPHEGSTIASPLRKLVYTFASNPQEAALRVHDPQVARVLGDIDERIESVLPGDPKGWPVPIRCFSGEQDRIVLEASARGPFDLCSPMKGDHSTILGPDDPTDPRYERLAEALLEPDGHAHVWEIDLFEQRVEVEPLVGKEQEIVAKYGGHERAVHTDNLARVRRSVTFSRKNRCLDLFTLRYATRSNGFIEPVMSHANEAPTQDACAWEDHGTETVFKFTPKSDERYELDLNVYKGFDVGSRDVHFHLGKWQSRYKKVRFHLDLSAYAGSGEKPFEPRFRYYEQDTGHDDLCRKRVLASDPLDPIETDGKGVWTWELHEVRRGIYDIAWDRVEAKASAPTATAGSG